MFTENSLEIHEVSLDEITPYPANVKIHTKETTKRLADSILRFGFNQPILVDEGAVILAGHGRFLAAKVLKLPSVPVIRLVHLNEDEKRAYRIVDNKTTRDTAWDLINLEEEVKKLLAIDFDIKPFGLDDFIPSVPEDLVPPDQRTQDKETLADKKEAYDNASIRQIVLLYDNEIHESVLRQLGEIGEKEDLQTNSEVVRMLVERYFE